MYIAWAGVMIRKASDWASPKLVCLPNIEAVGPNFSDLTLLALQELYTAFPNRTDLNHYPPIDVHKEEFGRLWDWLVQHGVVCGPLSNCALTCSGRDSLVAALQRQPQMAEDLIWKEAALDAGCSSGLLVRMLRHHFEKLQK